MAHSSASPAEQNPDISSDQGNAPISNLVGHSGAEVAVQERPSWRMSPAIGISLLLVTTALSGLCVWIALTSIFSAESALATSSTLGVVLPIVGAVIFGLTALLLLGSFVIVSPGHTSVVQFFGRYIGTVRHTGLSFVPPLTNREKISVRVRNFETDTIKVNDAGGNPISIGAIVVWQIADTAKATFAVEDVEEFIHSQADSALRHVASTHPYDGGSSNQPSLSGSTDLVSRELAEEVAARVQVAGLEIIEARISALSYAPEIAQAMLQRQQAAAVIDARETIVDGAVSIVQDAISQLEKSEVVELDPERRAAMVSNLLVVLCSDSSTQPVVNAGTLYN